MLSIPSAVRMLSVLAVGAAVSVAAPAALAVAATPAPAASAPVTVTGVHGEAVTAIALRLKDLANVTADVTRNSYLGSDQAVILAHVQADTTGLQAVGQKVAADTTVAGARADAATIYSGYRILALVLPAVHLTEVADEIETFSGPRLTAESVALAARVDSADSAVVDPLLGDLTSQIQSAQSAISGLGATLVSYTASQWNADNSLLSAATAADKTAADAVSGLVAMPRKPAVPSKQRGHRDRPQCTRRRP